MRLKQDFAPVSLEPGKYPHFGGIFLGGHSASERLSSGIRSALN